LNWHYFSLFVSCDSTSAIQIENNHVRQEQAKHIDIDCHFIREHVAAGFIKLIHIPSKYQLADLLDKGFTLQLFP
jgi:hypothetical protein